MANITRRSGEITPAREWDPFRLMREMLRWDPFRELAPYRPEETGYVTWSPTFDVRETHDYYIFKADLPGVKEDDLDIAVSGNRLTVNGKREAEEKEEGETYYTYERSFGSFSRSFTLPEDTSSNDVRAELKSGVLTLVLPKKPEHQPKRITVKAGSEKEKAKA